MQYLNTVRIFLQPLYRILLSHHGPINIHLEKYKRRISILQEQLIDAISFHTPSQLGLRTTRIYLGELHLMVVIAERNTGRFHDLTRLVKNLADESGFLGATGTRLPGLDQVLHA